MGGSRKSRPSFLQSLVLEVDLRADAEVTTHDVRTSPGRIEAEQAIGRGGIERRLGVEQVEQVRIDGELVTDLLRHGQVKIPAKTGTPSCWERVWQYVLITVR